MSNPPQRLHVTPQAFLGMGYTDHDAAAAAADDDDNDDAGDVLHENALVDYVRVYRVIPDTVCTPHGLSVVAVDED